MKSAFLYLCASLLIFTLSGCGSSAPAEVNVGSKAPSFSLKSLDGVKVSNRTYEGDIVVLNFWATYCAPCRKEIPELKELAATEKVKVVGIALDKEGLTQVKPYVDRMDINYPILLGNEDVFTRFQGLSIPYTLVLDRQHNIVKIYRGPTTKKDLEADLQKIGV